MRVVVLEDTVLLQEGLVRLLGGYGHETVAQLVTADGLIEAVEEHEPDLVIADVRLPPTFTDEGIQAAVALRAIRPSQPILILSQYVEERYASELLGGDASGLGYLLKERVADVKDFIDACTRVAEGGTVLDPEVVAQLLARRRREPLDMLTGARTRGALAHGRGTVERRDRAQARDLRGSSREAHLIGVREAGPDGDRDRAPSCARRARAPPRHDDDDDKSDDRADVADSVGSWLTRRGSRSRRWSTCRRCTRARCA